MIYCVWYPSGGFGHFINGILTLHGKDFKRPTGRLTFSSTGDSHSLDLVAPKYQGEPYYYDFDPAYNYSVLVDLGINSTDRKFMQQFTDARVIKMCYTDAMWPVVANTMIDKALKSSTESILAIDPESWTSTEAWAQREKYFLFLRDHALRTAWRPTTGIDCIFINDLLNYARLKYRIEQLGIELSEFKSLWSDWYTYNEKYFVATAIADQVLDKIEHKESFDLSHITDVWTQAVIYYYIWTEYDREVPHNDFANFFTNTDQITEWLQH